MKLDLIRDDLRKAEDAAARAHDALDQLAEGTDGMTDYLRAQLLRVVRHALQAITHAGIVTTGRKAIQFDAGEVEDPLGPRIGPN